MASTRTYLPSGGTCTATLRDGTRWSDRFNTEVTANGIKWKDSTFEVEGPGLPNGLICHARGCIVGRRMFIFTYLPFAPDLPKQKGDDYFNSIQLTSSSPRQAWEACLRIATQIFDGMPWLSPRDAPPDLLCHAKVDDAWIEISGARAWTIAAISFGRPYEEAIADAG